MNIILTKEQFNELKKVITKKHEIDSNYKAITKTIKEEILKGQKETCYLICGKKSITATYNTQSDVSKLSDDDKKRLAEIEAEKAEILKKVENERVFKSWALKG